MFNKHRLIGTAAGAALALGTWVHADVTTNSATPPQSADTTLYKFDDATLPAQLPAAIAATSPTPPVTPLNGALAQIPGWSDLGIKATGFVEGSWTYSAHPPAGNILTDRSFDTKTETFLFDQLDLNLQRSVDYTKQFDVGFDIEAIYGWDTQYFHSNGLTVSSAGHTVGPYPGSGTTATIHPKAQLDPYQANFTLGFKVGNGLGILGGKFPALVGYELVEASVNPFYSHSYIFTEEPHSATGMLGIYNLTNPSDPTKSSTIEGGFSRGWDQATDDDNGSLDYMAKFKYSVKDVYQFNASIITGDEQPTGVQDGWRTLIDVYGTYNIGDQWLLGYNGMYAWQAQAKNGGIGGGTGQWFGAAAYLNYQLNEFLGFNVRGEWFDDMNGAAPTQLSSGLTNIPNQFYEVTVGLSYKPFADNKYLSGLTIRPEGRWDYSGHAAFNGGAQNDQWTGAIEAYLAF